MFENKEEREDTAYYDLRIDHLSTRARIEFDETGQNFRKAWMGRVFFDLKRLQLLESDTWCEHNDCSLITLAIEDNGADGDGLWLKVVLEHTSDTFADKDGGELLAVSLTPQQARTLAKALLSVYRLRGGTL